MNAQLPSIDTSVTTTREKFSTFDRRNDVSAVLHALWVGESTAVYLAGEVNAVAVRHGAAPLSDAEFQDVVDMVTQTCVDTGIRTVLLDFRGAPGGCACALCESQGSPERVVIAAAQDPSADTLTKGLRAFHTFKDALNFVRPKKIASSSVPCPWGFERILATVQEQSGKLVFGNFAGTVFELPQHNAVLLHWSGDLSDESAILRALNATGNAIKRMSATRLVLDHRDRVDLPVGIGKHLIVRSLAPELSSSITHAISIGAWPRNRGSVEDMIRPSVDGSWKIFNVHSLKEALTLARTSGRARRDGGMTLAA